MEFAGDEYLKEVLKRSNVEKKHLELAKCARMPAATERCLEILRTIPTEFHGEYTKNNIEG